MVTLAILVIATILVVGFVTSMRTERQASVSMADNERAILIARSALDHAISILEQNIPQPAPPAASPYPVPPAAAPLPAEAPVNWVINPGRLTKQSGPPTNSPQYIPLSSNPSTTYVAVADDANLNPPSLAGGGNLTLGTTDPMRVAWIPVLKDPTIAASATNPIIGRYGFWIDDENARVDVNTAFGKGLTTGGAAPQVVPGTITVNTKTYPVGHPTSVNLDTLDAGFSKATLASATMRQEPSHGDMQSTMEAKPFFSSAALFEANKFFLTTSSNDPEFNVFGKSRLFFGSSLATTVTKQFNQFAFDWEAASYFGRDENQTLPAADSFSLYRTAAAIANILNRNDWPGMPARSFVDKWGGGTIGQREADQVAWNIVALGGYGNVSAPSANNAEGNVFLAYRNLLTTGTGATGSSTLPNSALSVGRLSGKAIMPALPKPGIQEIALTVTPTASSTAGQSNVQLGLQCEFYNGDRFPTSKLNDSSTGLGFYLTYVSYTVTDTVNASIKASQTENTYFLPAPQSPIYSGVSALYGFTPTNPLVSFNPGTFRVISTNTGRFVWAKNGAGSLNRTQSGSQNFSSTAIVRVQVQMRLANKYSGSANLMPIQVIPVWDTHDSATALQPPTPSDKDTVDFDFDVDLSGGPVTKSIEIASPQLAGRAASWTGTSAPTLGASNQASVSAGDLSKLNAYNDLMVGSYTGSERPSIGMVSVIPTGMQRGLTTTVKLQPAGSTAELPDWLLLDLLAPSFEVPPSLSLKTPVSVNNSTSGKINVNAQIYPTGTTFAPPERALPLQAVFANMGSATIATNLLHFTKAGGGVDFGISDAYDYVGEICETAGVADTGASDWDKEFLIRNLAGLLTTKSNSFRVIGLAQVIKKKPGNTDYGIFETGDVVTGEKRFESIVQRYIWQGKDGIQGNGHIDSTGKYDRLFTGAGLNTATGPMTAPDYGGGAAAKWERIDGPDAPSYIPPSGWASPNYLSSNPAFQASLESADNPLRAVAKYRTVYFHYLND